jgi:hypothetical protein
MLSAHAAARRPARYFESDVMAPRNPARAIAALTKPSDFASAVNFSTNALP